MFGWTNINPNKHESEYIQGKWKYDCIIKNELVKEFIEIGRELFVIKHKKMHWTMETHKHYDANFKKTILLLLWLNKNREYGTCTYTIKRTKVLRRVAFCNIPKEVLMFEIFTYFSIDHFSKKKVHK